MKLEDLPGGTPIFVDANIFIYHFSGISLECRAFLQRCESRPVEAFTGVYIVLEVMHRLMMLEALQKGLMTNDSITVALMRKLSLTAIATADADFDDISALRVYQPGDIS